MQRARTNILNRLKTSQERRGQNVEDVPDLSSDIYLPLNSSLAQEFKTNLEAIGGQVILCNTVDETVRNIQEIAKNSLPKRIFCTDTQLMQLIEGHIDFDREENEFLNLSVGLTRCELLVAHLGSVLISSAQISGRRLNVYPETHVIVANETQLVDFLDHAMELMQEKYKNRLPSLISNITGPSRTADIEKTLVMGMHGPKNLIVIVTAEPF